MDVARGEAAREDVDGTGRVDGTRREHIDEQELAFGNGMHGNVAIVVQEHRGEAAGASVTHRWYAAGVDSRSARGGDDQAADEGAVGQLVRRYADEVSGEVLILARQARQSTDEGGTDYGVAARQARPGAME
jgi:hypothetical protein